MYPNATFYDWVGESPVPGVTDPTLMYTVYPPQNLTALNGTYRLGIRLNGKLLHAIAIYTILFMVVLFFFIQRSVSSDNIQRRNR